MKYKCKENDTIIELHEDELWIGVDGDDKCGKTVIGLKDLNQALNLFGVIGSCSDFKEWCEKNEQTECQREQRTLTAHELYHIYSEEKGYLINRLKFNKMTDFKKYRRKQQLAELRQVTEEDIKHYKGYKYLQATEHPDGGWNEVSISMEDKTNGSPKIGDMIARNPKNHDDQWLIAEEYFKENFEQRFMFSEFDRLRDEYHRK